MEGRIVSRRLVYHADKCSALFHSEFRRVLRKESLGRGLDAIGAATEENGIQVHVQNFILGIVTLKFHGGYPLLEFDPDHLHLGKTRNPAGNVGTRVQCLRKLLCDGTSAALTRIAQEQGLHEHAAETRKVNTGVVVESDVFSSDRSLDEIW